MKYYLSVDRTYSNYADDKKDKTVVECDSLEKAIENGVRKCANADKGVRNALKTVGMFVDRCGRIVKIFRKWTIAFKTGFTENGEPETIIVNCMALYPLDVKRLVKDSFKENQGYGKSYERVIIGIMDNVCVESWEVVDNSFEIKLV